MVKRALFPAFTGGYHLFVRNPHLRVLKGCFRGLRSSDAKNLTDKQGSHFFTQCILFFFIIIVANFNRVQEKDILCQNSFRNLQPLQMLYFSVGQAHQSLGLSG